MNGCHEVITHCFATIENQVREFRERYCDLAPVVENLNYLDNANFVDAKWFQTLEMWSWKVYFNAGMNYGQAFNKLYEIRPDFDDSAKQCDPGIIPTPDW